MVFVVWLLQSEFLGTAARLHGSDLDDAMKVLLTELCRTCRGRLNPVSAVFGGFVGQEVLKACSAKFTPLNQFLYMDFCEVGSEDVQR